jgi:hypothetical protein
VIDANGDVVLFSPNMEGREPLTRLAHGISRPSRSRTIPRRTSRARMSRSSRSRSPRTARLGHSPWSSDGVWSRSRRRAGP